jgi:hypothetical protein
MKKLHGTRASLLDRDGLGRPDIHAGTFPHTVILGVQSNRRFSLHQIHQLMCVLVGTDIQLFARVEPVEGTDYIFSAAELFIQNFGDFARTGLLNMRNFVRIDEGQ